MFFLFFCKKEYPRLRSVFRRTAWLAIFFDITKENRDGVGWLVLLTRAEKNAEAVFFLLLRIFLNRLREIF